MIQTVVEGNGEIDALPVLLRRLVFELGCYEQIGSQPFRENRTGLVQEAKFKRAIQIVSSRPATNAVLVLFDADDDCARDIIPKMIQWSQEVIPSTPCAILMARREYEAWFLAGIESLRGKRRIKDDAHYNEDPELKRDAKGIISRWMPKNKPYSETADQVALSAELDFSQAYRRASSFRKLVKEVYRLLEKLGQNPIFPDYWAVE